MQSSYTLTHHLIFIHAQTALHTAVKEGSLASVKLLLEHGANVHQRDKYSKSILLDAIKYDQPGSNIVELLLYTGAHFCAEEQKDVAYLLTQAVVSNNLDKVKLFIRAGADPNIPYIDGRTPLHLAVSDNRIEIVKAFLEMNDATFLYATSKVVDWLTEDEAEMDTAPLSKESLPPATMHASKSKGKSPVEKTSTKSKVANAGTTTTSAVAPPAAPKPALIVPFLRYRLNISPIDRWQRSPLMDAELLGHTELAAILKKAISEENTHIDVNLKFFGVS